MKFFALMKMSKLPQKTRFFTFVPQGMFFQKLWVKILRTIYEIIPDFTRPLVRYRDKVDLEYNLKPTDVHNIIDRPHSINL